MSPSPDEPDEELIASLLRRLMPHIQRRIMSRTTLPPHAEEHHASSNIANVFTATPTLATAAPAPRSISRRRFQATRRQQQTNVALVGAASEPPPTTTPPPSIASRNFTDAGGSPRLRPSPPVTSHQSTHSGLHVPATITTFPGGRVRPPTVSPHHAPTTRHAAHATSATSALHYRHAPTTAPPMRQAAQATSATSSARHYAPTTAPTTRHAAHAPSATTSARHCAPPTAPTARHAAHATSATSDRHHASTTAPLLLHMHRAPATASLATPATTPAAATTAAAASVISPLQAVLAANLHERHYLELNSKFETLENSDTFHWWHHQLRGRLQHEAWENILSGGEPYLTVDSNRAISNKLSQRLHQAIPATMSDAIGGADDFDGLGLELLQAIINHFIMPSTSVHLPTIFREWSELRQQRHEGVAAFSGRVTRLASRSTRAGQSYSEVSQILTFVSGLHGGFADFANDYFSGRICLTDTTLRDTTALAKTLELTMDKWDPDYECDDDCVDVSSSETPSDDDVSSYETPRDDEQVCRHDDDVDVFSGPLSDEQVHELFANFDCPLCRTNDHTCIDCHVLDDQGFIIANQDAEHPD
jgi:hypothetical protein